jgi:hypothetical protein
MRDCKGVLTLKYVRMVYTRLIVIVLLAKLLCTVRAQCPSLCVCSVTEANCTDIALTEFPSSKFGRHVREVDFSYNNITSLDEYTIRKWMIISLRLLNISNNALRIVNDFSFVAQSGLQVIDLSGNELDHISENTFTSIPKLTWLSLANNRKLKIPDNVPFLQNSNLQVLHLENCGLYSITLSSFIGLISLTELYLSYNKITTVDVGLGTVGHPVLKIRYLELSHNSLQEVPRALTQLQSLEDLGMCYNELRNLSDILRVERHVKRLNIRNNGWECLCEVCDIKSICDNISCQVDLCGSSSKGEDSVRCLSEHITTTVNESLIGYTVSSVEPHAPEKTAATMSIDVLFLIITCCLGTLCVVLALVSVYLKLRLKNRSSHNMNPEQSVPLTVVTSQS